MNEIVLHVTYRCLPGKAMEFVQVLREAGLPQTVRQEDGCLQYDYHLSCEQDDCVVLLERWRDRQALQRHSGQPHMAEIARAKTGRVQETQVQRFACTAE